ncbi:MAG: response regulator [Leptospiraceae bacterium]|nr:response regulator [Leptospiraceae bacterium]MCP5494343.1 response regulator [Leptospiraceae bacterium]
MSKTIFVVDDNIGNIQVVANFLKGEGYKVIVATNGKIALDSVKERSYDLILLDIMMPDISGFDVCQEIKSNPMTANIPVIFLTSKTDVEEITKAFELGAVDYITKPFNYKELLARVRTHIELGESRESRRRELEVAKRIQDSILPTNLDSIKGLRFCIKYLANSELSGDIYDVFEVLPGYVRIFLADATGHGINAALVTMLIKSEYEKLKEIIKDPAEILSFLNNEFIRSYNQLKEIFPAFILDIDLNRKNISYASAGNCTQIFLSNSKIIDLEKTGRILGIVEDCHYKQKYYSISSGDKFLIFTDGLYEQFNEKDEEFGLKKIAESIEKMIHEPIDVIINNLFKILRDYIGPKQSFTHNDDVTVIGIEID